MRQEHYTYIWEYEVPPSAQAEFLAHYAVNGSWARLFRRAPGYLGTELYHDRKRRDRFVTIDHWQSEVAFRSFRVRFAADFEMLDRQCDALTTRETSLGHFQLLADTVEHLDVSDQL